MKINAKTMDYLQPTIPIKQKKTDDEYYWQHQHQLENSALSFHRHLCEHRESPTAFILAQRPVINKNPIDLATSIVTRQKNNRPSKFDLLPTEADLSKQPHKIDEQSCQLLEINSRSTNQANFRQPSFPPTRGELSLKKQKIFNNENTLAKNFHLFISGNEAELSLNTTQLNKQQTKEIINLVKQWLANKGVRLQQLFINGVQ